MWDVPKFRRKKTRQKGRARKKQGAEGVSSALVGLVAVERPGASLAREIDPRGEVVVG